MAIKIRKRDQDNRPDDEAAEQQAPQGAVGSDPLAQTAMRGASWLEDNRNLVIGAVIALVVAVVGVWIGLNYVESQEREASATLSPALWSYSVPVEGSPEMEMLRQSPNVDPPDETFSSDQERWQAVYEQANSSLEQHQQGELAQSARLTKAAAAYRLGNHDEAIELYNTYLDGETDESLLPLAYMGLANAQAAKGDTEAAVETYDRFAEQGDDYESLAMYQKAKVLEAGGNVEQAKTIYHEVLETYPQTPYRDDIERRLALL